MHGLLLLYQGNNNLKSERYLEVCRTVTQEKLLELCEISIMKSHTLRDTPGFAASLKPE